MIRGLVLLFVLAAGSAWAARTLTNDDVTKLVRAGIGDQVIVTMIEGSDTAFDTSVGTVLALSRAGVSDAVIAAMVKAGQPDPAESHTEVDVPVPSATSAMAGSMFRETLRSGGAGPAMVVIPAGRFQMGCLSNDDACLDVEKPVRVVAIPVPFALSVYEVTSAEYDRFARPYREHDADSGRRPAVDVSWNDAQKYAAWLSEQTGARYRLPSEAEWEYAARAGTTTKYHWGDGIGRNRANCDGCRSQWDDMRTAPVGSFQANGFRLHDMHGNAFEWVEDCWNESYAGAPSDGSAWRQGDCGSRVMRGGTFSYHPRYLRSASRGKDSAGSRSRKVGFRVARTLTP